MSRRGRSKGGRRPIGRQQRRRRRHTKQTGYCRGKQVIKNEQDAVRMVETLAGETVYIGGVGVNGALGHYQCPVCEFWHVGHRRSNEPLPLPGADAL